jgi:uncharacterized surface protein with fasciclin (FAS1) repeats
MFENKKLLLILSSLCFGHLSSHALQGHLLTPTENPEEYAQLAPHFGSAVKNGVLVDPEFVLMPTDVDASSGIEVICNTHGGIRTETYRVVREFADGPTTLKLVQLDRPVLNVAPALRVRSVDSRASSLLYLVSYDEMGTERQIGSTRAVIGNEDLYFRINFNLGAQDGTSYEATMDPNDYFDLGAGVYIRLANGSYGLVGLLREASYGLEALVENILPINAWIDNTILTASLGNTGAQSASAIPRRLPHPVAGASASGPGGERPSPAQIPVPTTGAPTSLPLPQPAAGLGAGSSDGGRPAPTSIPGRGVSAPLPVFQPAAGPSASGSGGAQPEPQTNDNGEGNARRGLLAAIVQRAGRVNRGRAAMANGDAIGEVQDHVQQINPAIGAQGTLIASNIVLARHTPRSPTTIKVGPEEHRVAKVVRNYEYGIQLIFLERDATISPVTVSFTDGNTLVSKELFFVKQVSGMHLPSTVSMEPCGEFVRATLLQFANKVLLEARSGASRRTNGLKLELGSGVFTMDTSSQLNLVGVIEGTLKRGREGNVPVALLNGAELDRWIKSVQEAYSERDEEMLQILETSTKTVTPVVQKTASAKFKTSPDGRFLTICEGRAVQDIFTTTAKSVPGHQVLQKAVTENYEPSVRAGINELRTLIMDYLVDGKKFTVFLPTDQAINRLTPDAWVCISGDKGLLAQFLKAHIVIGSPFVPSEQLMGTLRTLCNAVPGEPPHGVVPTLVGNPIEYAGNVKDVPKEDVEQIPFQPWCLNYTAGGRAHVARVQGKGLPSHDFHVYPIDCPILNNYIIGELTRKGIRQIFRNSQ